MASEPLVLPNSLDAAAARPLLEILRARRGEALAIDGAEVTRLGGACLQVLLSAAQAWAQDRKSFGLVKSSETLAQDLRRMGAVDLLNWRERTA